MNPKAMEPYGEALLAYYKGETNAELIIHRDDSQATPLPVKIFFRDLSSPIDNMAINRCVGHVLDIGAGTGLHSQALLKKGLIVTAIDIDPLAVTIMRQQGLKDVHCADIFEFQGSCFDTLLMMGHGIGVVETIVGLDRFLTYAYNTLSEDGQLLLDSLDVRITDNQSDLAYQKANLQAGRYIGEIRMQFEFQKKKGPYFGWLHVDAETLKDHAELLGWRVEVIYQEENGNYLALLKKA